MSQELKRIPSALDSIPTKVTFEQVNVFYGNHQALHNVSLSIPKGRVTVIIGPSGCGKSTTLRCINRLVATQSGTITVDNNPIESYKPETLRRNIGYAIQSVGLFPHLSVSDNISILIRILKWSPEHRHHRVRELLKLVGLDPERYSPKFPRQLSGGEAQRIGVARALAANPDLLLMDEPFGAVDPLTRENLQDEFIRIQRQLKKTIVFVTHDLDEAVRLADFLVIMKDGKIIQADSTTSILAEPQEGFVTDFLGPNRTLKRLTLYTVDQFLEPAQTHPCDKPLPPQETTANSKALWIVNETGTPQEVLIQRHKTLIQKPIVLESHSVKPYSSLKEALSRILSLGIRVAPIIDNNNCIIGEIAYERIEELSLQ